MHSLGMTIIKYFNIKKPPALSGRFFLFEIIYLAFALLRIQRVQALTRLPSNTAYCKLGKSLTIEALIEWERFMVLE